MPGANQWPSPLVVIARVVSVRTLSGSLLRQPEVEAIWPFAGVHLLVYQLVVCVAAQAGLEIVSADRVAYGYARRPTSPALDAQLRALIQTEGHGVLRLGSIRPCGSPMPSVLRFDRFEFHIDSGELITLGSRVRLETQPPKLVALLACRPGDLVSREELRREIWPADTFVDFERGINYCIRSVRRALDDSAAAPRFIETLPRRGYRFLPAVE